MVDDDWEELEFESLYGSRDWLERLAMTVYRDGTDPIGHVLGLQIYDAARNQMLDDQAAQPYVDVLERVLNGEPPRWT